MNNNECKASFSWKATLVGGLLAFGLLFLFNLLAIGSGLASYARVDQGGLETVVAFAYLWTALGSFFILFIAGMVTSMLGYHDHNLTEIHHSLLHGFITWVFYILISLTFLSNVREEFTVIFPKNFFTLSEKLAANAHSPAIFPSKSPTTSTTPATENSQKEVRKWGIATLASFFIFALEALGACFGAWLGMDICRKRSKHH